MSLLLQYLMLQVIVGSLHCQATLSGYNFSLVYRAGGKTQDADALSRLPSTDKETLFNDVIKVISQAVLVSCEEAPGYPNQRPISKNHCQNLV